MGLQSNLKNFLMLLKSFLRNSVYITKLKPGSAISKDEKCSIIEIKWDGLKYELPANKETRKRIKDDIKGFSSQLSKRLGVVVEWESSYGEKGKIQSHPSEA